MGPTTFNPFYIIENYKWNAIELNWTEMRQKKQLPSILRWIKEWGTANLVGGGLF